MLFYGRQAYFGIVEIFLKGKELPVQEAKKNFETIFKKNSNKFSISFTKILQYRKDLKINLKICENPRD